MVPNDTVIPDMASWGLPPFTPFTCAYAAVPLYGTHHLTQYCCMPFRFKLEDAQHAVASSKSR